MSLGLSETNVAAKPASSNGSSIIHMDQIRKVYDTG
jgi:hypothetical protein